MNIDQHYATLEAQYQRRIDAEAALEAAPITAQELIVALSNCTDGQYERFVEIASRTHDAELRRMVDLLVMQERDK